MLGCARCSVCGINYAPALASGRCQVRGCTELLAYISNVEQDADWRDRVATLNRELEAAQDVVAVDELRLHRVRQFERLGFPDYAAEVLADARDALGFPLWWGRVDSALTRGATHAQALRIFA